MAQRFTASERRGLIALLVVMAIVVGYAAWRHYSLPSESVSVTVEAASSGSAPIDSVRVSTHEKKTHKKESSKKSKSKARKKGGKSASKVSPSAPARNPLSEPVN